MGDGKRLKEVIDEKKTSVRKVAIGCGIAPTTLYSIIKRDSSIRYDFALRIANVLEIPEEMICAAAPVKKMDEEKTFSPEKEKTDREKTFSPEIEKMLSCLPKRDRRIVEGLIKALYESHVKSLEVGE